MILAFLSFCLAPRATLIPAIPFPIITISIVSVWCPLPWFRYRMIVRVEPCECQYNSLFILNRAMILVHAILVVVSIER